MKRCAIVTIASLLLLFTNLCNALADGTYYPYQMYEEFHKKGASQPPQPPPPSQQQPAAGTKTPPRANQPTALERAPEFLFPKELGFGVAIAVPYDMFYLSELYYLVNGNMWYRSSSYQGPWVVVALNKLPPVLLKHNLARIRQLRNQEFEEFWKNRDHYQGRHFRPGRKLQEQRKEKPGAPQTDRRPN